MAFVADAHEAWREALCVIEERSVANDNTIAWDGRRLQLPESRLRPHFVKAVVRVHEYLDGTASVFLGPHRLATFAADGSLLASPMRLKVGSRLDRAKGWPGRAGAWRWPGATATLDPACACRPSASAGRDEETGFEPNRETDQDDRGDDTGSHMTDRPGRPRLPDPSAPPTKATDHELPKHDNFTSYGQVGRQGGSRSRDEIPADRIDCRPTWRHLRFRDVIRPRKRLVYRACPKTAPG